MQSLFFLVAIIANLAMAALASPLAIRDDAPPPEGGGLTWCTKQDDKFCTVGKHHYPYFTVHRLPCFGISSMRHFGTRSR